MEFQSDAKKRNREFYIHVVNEICELNFNWTLCVVCLYGVPISRMGIMIKKSSIRRGGVSPMKCASKTINMRREKNYCKQLNDKSGMKTTHLLIFKCWTKYWNELYDKGCYVCVVFGYIHTLYCICPTVCRRASLTIECVCISGICIRDKRWVFVIRDRQDNGLNRFHD